MTRQRPRPGRSSSRALARLALGLIPLAGVGFTGCQMTGGDSPVIKSQPEPARSAQASRSNKGGGPSGLDATAGIRPEGASNRTDFRPDADIGQRAGVHIDMGKGHEANGQLEAAAADYLRALDSLEGPNRAAASARSTAAPRALAHRRLATTLDRLGRFGQADVHYKAALAAAPDDPKVWNDAGYSAFVQGRFADAERSLRTAARLAPDDTRVATNLGLALAAAGKEDEALKVLARVGGPASAAQGNVAYGLAAAGLRDRAAARYRMVLEAEPGLRVAQEGLARLSGPDAGQAGLVAATFPKLPAGSDPKVVPASATVPPVRR